MIRPRLLAALVCDAVTRRPGGCPSLLGLVGRLTFTDFPAALDGASVFVRFAFGEGEHRLAVRLADASGTAVFALREPARVRFDDPLSVVDVVVRVESLIFPAPGTYFLELALDGTPVENGATLFVDRVEAALPAAPPDSAPASATDAPSAPGNNAGDRPAADL